MLLPWGGYVVSFPELLGCLTCADTIESAILQAEDAKKAWLEAALKEQLPISEPQATESCSGQFQLQIPKSLHQQLALYAKQEGINMNQSILSVLVDQTGYSCSSIKKKNLRTFPPVSAYHTEAGGFSIR